MRPEPPLLAGAVRLASDQCAAGAAASDRAQAPEAGGGFFEGSPMEKYEVTREAEPAIRANLALHASTLSRAAAHERQNLAALAQQAAAVQRETGAYFVKLAAD